MKCLKQNSHPSSGSSRGQISPRRNDETTVTTNAVVVNVVSSSRRGEDGIPWPSSLRVMFVAWALIQFLSVFPPHAFSQATSVINSPHNLSATGPGAIRASSEQQVCIFCHAPHNASFVQPLWNRSASVAAYKVYTSNSLQATPGQPTGSSKLCLSCHDGTIAVGSVISRNMPIGMAGSITTLPPGKSNLGTDLSDDHPISFRYDSNLVNKNPSLKNPATLPPAIRLDANQELQCTSCHNAHDNSIGKFLVADNSSSQLCNSCHQQGTTTVANHVNCNSCHQSHSAPSGPYLLKQTTVTSTCITCHNGQPTQPQGPNIYADLQKASKHDTNSAINLPNHVPDNVGCSDCHESHTMGTGSAAAPAAPPNFGKINGVNISGTNVAQVTYGYEVCLKCHSNPATTKVTLLPRQIVQTNLAAQFSPSAISYHPVAAVGKGTNLPSLLPPYTSGSIIACTDCHASESSKTAGGTGPNGPHGSANPRVLIARYVTTDPSTESTSAYALCYRCHSRAVVTGESGAFRYHKKHVVEERTSCAVCHDSHGIASGVGTPQRNAHLINFNSSVVTPINSTTPVSYNSTARTCTLRCHGASHNNWDY